MASSLSLLRLLDVTKYFNTYLTVKPEDSYGNAGNLYRDLLHSETKKENTM